MPIPVAPLSDTQIRKAKPRERTYKLFDGGGLYLEVIPSGSKLWRMKFRQASGKESRLSFRPCPEVSLSEARAIMDEVLGERVDLIEHQLAHRVKDPNGRAYNRTAHLPAR